MIRKNRKAQVITLIAIALILLLVVSYSVYTLARKDKGIKQRVKTMDSFLSSMEKDLERNLYVSGFRTIFLAEIKIADTGDYLDNFTNFFYESIYNGTVDGSASEIMTGATIQDIEDSINQSASKLNLEVSLTNKSVFFNQEDPWHVMVGMNFTLNLTDKANLANWYVNKTVKAYIEIEVFEDPLFLVETYGKISRKFNKTIYDNNYVSLTDVSNLSDHVKQGYYSANSEAPSFLNRLEGDLSPDENGIESFVYIPDLSSQGIPVKEKSLIDYIYFSTQNPSYSSVTGMASWFRIDQAHEVKYQVEDLT